MPTDIEIARSVTPLPITEVAKNAGVDVKHLIPYGFDKAKVDYSLLNEPTNHQAKLVLVTAINPTPAGEGKTTTTIGLADGLRRRGVKSAVALREPSLGPVFGVKGGAAEWDVKDGVFTVNKKKGDIQTKQKFNDFQMHIEWQVPTNITGESQSRGNSGIFLQGMYEVQVLDCYNNPTYVNGQTGSIYKQSIPLANAMRKPGEWNVYDIIYTAPTFKEDGSYRTHPTVTVIQNGVVLQNHTTILGTTEWIGFPQVKKHGAGPIILQSHGDPSEPISFRNIWIREL